jgi:hypothetical protein
VGHGRPSRVCAQPELLAVSKPHLEFGLNVTMPPLDQKQVRQPVTFETTTAVHGIRPTLHGGGFLYTEVWLGA